MLVVNNKLDETAVKGNVCWSVVDSFNLELEIVEEEIFSLEVVKWLGDVRFKCFSVEAKPEVDIELRSLVVVKFCFSVVVRLSKEFKVVVIRSEVFRLEDDVVDVDWCVVDSFNEALEEKDEELLGAVRFKCFSVVSEDDEFVKLVVIFSPTDDDTVDNEAIVVVSFNNAGFVDNDDEEFNNVLVVFVSDFVTNGDDDDDAAVVVVVSEEEDEILEEAKVDEYCDDVVLRVDDCDNDVVAFEFDDEISEGDVELIDSVLDGCAAEFLVADK